VDPQRCTREGACVDACPTGAIALREDGWSIDPGRCVFCAACLPACPTSAIGNSPTVLLATGSAGGIRGAGDPGETLRTAIQGRLGRSLHVRHLDAGSCNGCDWEIAALLNPYHDVQRLGIDFVASPRHADVLLVTGVLTRNLEEAALRTYEAMPEPRLVVALGACAISGGVFRGSYAGRDGVCGALPVDVYVPGCPPRPEAIIAGLLAAVGRLEPGRPTSARRPVPPPERAAGTVEADR